MKFAVSQEHRSYFQKNHAIQFEDLISLRRLKEPLLAIEQTLTNRLKIKREQLDQQTSQALYMGGRDLWRSNEQIKRITFSSRLAEVAYDLVQSKPLRLAYDQFFQGISPAMVRVNRNSYTNLFHQPHTLAEVSCCQKVICGLMLCLSNENPDSDEGSDEEISENPEGLNIFPTTPGNGVYFSPYFPIDFLDLCRKQQCRYLLIVYTHFHSFYVKEERDPHVHDWKRLGYLFGDKLNDKFNPIILR